jgi:hypothetical protein
MRRRSATTPRGPRSALTHSTSSPRATRGRPSPPRRVERPRALTHPDRPLDQRHPLVAAQGAPQAVDLPARATRRSPTGQQDALPRLPAQGRAAAALPTRRSPTRARAPRQLARLGIALTTAPVHQARAHDPTPPRRHPRRRPPRPLQRPPRTPQQPHPPNQPRSFGFHSAAPLIALVYLCCSNILIDLPR